MPSIHVALWRQGSELHSSMFSSHNTPVNNHKHFCVSHILWAVWCSDNPECLKSASYACCWKCNWKSELDAADAKRISFVLHKRERHSNTISWITEKYATFIKPSSQIQFMNKTECGWFCLQQIWSISAVHWRYFIFQLHRLDLLYSFIQCFKKLIYSYI
jgi:hypothetical protein